DDDTHRSDPVGGELGPVGDHGDVPRLGGGDVELPRAGDAGVEPGLNGAGHRARDALLTGDSVGLLADMAADQRFAGGCDGDDDTGEVLVVVADSDPAAQLDHEVERPVDGDGRAGDGIDVDHAFGIDRLPGPVPGRNEQVRFGR